MRHVLTALFLGSLVLTAQDSTTAPETVTHPGITKRTLLDATAEFDGVTSLQEIEQLLSANVPVDHRDSVGNTPLLYLCRPLEMDYRYTTDPHFAQALDRAIITLLRHGADILHENDDGCNAAFFLQSKPELLKTLAEEKLLPKTLAVRIPHESAAFYRYIRKRTAQAEKTSHEASRQYLSRMYCAPAYDRAAEQLAAYIALDSTERCTTTQLKELLAFMRLADPARAQEYVHGLRFWEHSEHFLEERPSRLLEALNSLSWEVDSTILRKALRKLDTMLPSSPDEMIDCFAAQPMGQLLEMLARREGDQALPIIRKYASCNEAELAYRAYKLLLRREGLPAPEPNELLERFAANGAATQETMNSTQRRLLESALVDEALRLGDVSTLDTAIVQRTIKVFRDMKLNRHAAILERLLQNGQLTADSYTIQAAHHSYIEQAPPSPRISMARYILEHAGQFADRSTEKQ